MLPGRAHVQASNGVDETSKQATIEKAVAISRMVDQMTTEQYQQPSYSHDEKQGFIGAISLPLVGILGTVHKSSCCIPIIKVQGKQATW
jgi:hypothetical protein